MPEIPENLPTVLWTESYSLQPGIAFNGVAFCEGRAGDGFWIKCAPGSRFSVNGVLTDFVGFTSTSVVSIVSDTELLITIEGVS